MNPNFVHAFLDKIQRYSFKPDRVLFSGQKSIKNIAFSTIINQAPDPEESNKTIIQLLQNYACATGLMVLPEFRHRDVGSKLVQQ